MYWASLYKTDTLQQCPYKSRKKRKEWLLQYFEDMEDDDEVAIFEPLDIITILEWLNV